MPRRQYAEVEIRQYRPGDIATTCARATSRPRKKITIVTIDDIAGPCNADYDPALAEFEVIRRHFPELLQLYRPPTAREIDQETERFLADALAKVMPLPIARRRGRRYADK